MKIMVRNVQGAKKHQIRYEIRIINQAHRPDLLFLIETMVSDQITRKLIAKLGFEHFDFVSPQNNSGGIWVLWNNANINSNSYSKKIELFTCLLWI